MRNLNIRICEVHPLELGSTETSNWYQDPDTGTIFVLSGSTIYKVDDQQDPQVLLDLSSSGYLESSVSCIGLCGIPDMTCLLLGLSTGELLQVDTDCGEMEEVGAVAGGLLAIAMSPDYDLLSIVTAELNVITMTRDYVPVSETPLQQSSFGEGEFVNVGWGAKETQFHGTEGKESREKKVESGSVTEKDDGKVRISWRGDGQMFCVSFVTTDNPRRRLLVLSRSGVLYSTSENCPGLEHTLAWRPSGNLIATTVIKPNKHVVAFFEKNGLQHGEFSLRKEAEVLEVEWNSDSSVLLVLTKIGTDHELEFWTVGNYHWYLKQSLPLQGLVIQPRWHQEDPQLLQFLHKTEGGGVELHSYRLAWTTNASAGLEDTDMAVVGVVDGAVVKVTPFRQAVVPPPLSAFEVHVEGQVKQLAFAQPVLQAEETDRVLSKASQDSNSFLIVTSKDEFIVMGLTETGDKLGGCDVKVTGAGGNGYTVKTSLHSVMGKLNVKWGEGDHGRYASNYTWLGDTVLASLSHPDPCLLVMKQTAPELITVVDKIPVECPVYSIISRPAGAVLQLQDGSLLEFSVLDGDLVPAEESFPRQCDQMIHTTAGVLGLTSRYRLYLNNTELANNVTSMWMHSDFLLVTTMEHQLLALPRNHLGEGSPRWQEAGKRRVERGSRIVCAVPKESRTVLQMPRGNLETIQPRSLSVLLVGGLLKKLQYSKAFILARRQRINLNLLVDHDYDELIKNIKEFVTQVGKDPQHLCIFIADLLDEDVCSTMYSAQYEGRAVVKPVAPKVECVCKVVREEIEKQDESDHKANNILPILATLVRDGGKLEEALLRIKSARDASLAAVADDALHFLLYMVDVNVLFDVALGTYDFGLVIMVAEKSQKDPKEYLPFLNNFKKMEEDYRKFSIDKHLKRYSSALTHVAKCENNFDECLQLVKEQRLYKLALKLFQRESDNYKSVCQCYAAYLETKKYHEESSVMYEQAGDLAAAVNMADSALRWQRAGDLARRAGWGQDQLNELYRGLAERLEGAGRGAEAADLLRDWLADSEEAVAVLARCHRWQEALRQSRDLCRMDLIETHVIPALLERRSVMAGSIASQSSDLSSHLTRLLLVRAARNNTNDDAEVEDDRNVDDADMFSDTTSVGGISGVSGSVRSRASGASLQTRNSQRSKSSKNRRKAERKLYSMREGSVYEDLGLMAEIHHILSGVTDTRTEVAELIRALVDVGKETQATDIQIQMDNFIKEAEESIPKVWTAAVLGSGGAETGSRFGPSATVEDIVASCGAAASSYCSPVALLEPHLRYPPRIIKDNYWKLEFLG